MTVQVADYVVVDLLAMLNDHQPEENPGGEPLCQVCGDYWHECPVMALKAAAAERNNPQ